MKFIWENMVLADGCTITASSSNSSFPASNVRSTTRAKEWRSANTQVSNQWVQFSYTSPVTLTTAVVLWDKNNYKLSPSAQVQIQGSALSTFSTIGFTHTLTFDDRQQMAYGTFNQQSYQYWRIRVHDPSSAYGYVHIGHVILGKEEAELKFPSIGFELTFNDLSERKWNEFGQAFIIQKPLQKELRFNLDLMSNQEWQALVDVAHKAQNKPIFILLDPLETYFQSKDFWIYGYLTNDLELQHVTTQYTSSKLVIREVL